MNNEENEAKDYYVMDAREVVGNCALWWRPDSKGYTCDLHKAGLYTEAQTLTMRYTDIPIHKDIVEGVTVLHARWDHLRRAGVEFKACRKTTAHRRRELEDRLAAAHERIAELEAR